MHSADAPQRHTRPQIPALPLPPPPRYAHPMPHMTAEIAINNSRRTQMVENIDSTMLSAMERNARSHLGDKTVRWQQYLLASNPTVLAAVRELSKPASGVPAAAEPRSARRFLRASSATKRQTTSQLADKSESPSRDRPALSVRFPEVEPQPSIEKQRAVTSTAATLALIVGALHQSTADEAEPCEDGIGTPEPRPPLDPNSPKARLVAAAQSLLPHVARLANEKSPEGEITALDPVAMRALVHSVGVAAEQARQDVFVVPSVIDQRTHFSETASSFAALMQSPRTIAAAAEHTQNALREFLQPAFGRGADGTAQMQARLHASEAPVSPTMYTSVVHTPVLNERARMLSPSALARADRATLQPHLAAIQAALNEEKRKTPKNPHLDAAIARANAAAIGSFTPVSPPVHQPAPPPPVPTPSVPEVSMAPILPEIMLQYASDDDTQESHDESHSEEASENESVLGDMIGAVHDSAADAQLLAEIGRSRLTPVHMSSSQSRLTPILRVPSPAVVVPHLPVESPELSPRSSNSGSEQVPVVHPDPAPENELNSRPLSARPVVLPVALGDGHISFDNLVKSVVKPPSKLKAANSNAFRSKRGVMRGSAFARVQATIVQQQQLVEQQMQQQQQPVRQSAALISKSSRPVPPLSAKVFTSLEELEVRAVARMTSMGSMSSHGSPAPHYGLGSECATPIAPSPEVLELAGFQIRSQAANLHSVRSHIAAKNRQDAAQRAQSAGRVRDQSTSGEPIQSSRDAVVDSVQNMSEGQPPPVLCDVIDVMPANEDQRNPSRIDVVRPQPVRLSPHGTPLMPVQLPESLDTDEPVDTLPALNRLPSSSSTPATVSRTRTPPLIPRLALPLKSAVPPPSRPLSSRPAASSRRPLSAVDRNSAPAQVPARSRTSNDHRGGLSLTARAAPLSARSRSTSTEANLPGRGGPATFRPASKRATVSAADISRTPRTMSQVDHDIANSLDRLRRPQSAVAASNYRLPPRYRLQADALKAVISLNRPKSAIALTRSLHSTLHEHDPRPASQMAHVSSQHAQMSDDYVSSVVQTPVLHARSSTNHELSAPSTSRPSTATNKPREISARASSVSNESESVDRAQQMLQIIAAAAPAVAPAVATATSSAPDALLSPDTRASFFITESTDVLKGGDSATEFGTLDDLARTASKMSMPHSTLSESPFAPQLGIHSGAPFEAKLERPSAADAKHFREQHRRGEEAASAVLRSLAQSALTAAHAPSYATMVLQNHSAAPHPAIPPEQPSALMAMAKPRPAAYSHMFRVHTGMQGAPPVPPATPRAVSPKPPLYSVALAERESAKNTNTPRLAVSRPREEKPVELIVKPKPRPHQLMPSAPPPVKVDLSIGRSFTIVSPLAAAKYANAPAYSFGASAPSKPPGNIAPSAQHQLNMLNLDSVPQPLHGRPVKSRPHGV